MAHGKGRGARDLIYGRRGGGWVPEGHDPQKPREPSAPSGHDIDYAEVWRPTTEQGWEGRARMAAARAAAGAPLDTIDRQALQKAGRPLPEPSEVLTPRLPVDRPQTATGAAHPDTSHRAAARTRPQSASDRLKVLEYVEQCGPMGATCDEVEEVLGMSHQTASARVNGLMNDRWLVDSGRRRPTRSGSDATVWIAA